jgi:ankyrin repeat protein
MGKSASKDASLIEPELDEQFYAAARDGDAVTVRTMLSTAAAQWLISKRASPALINYQDNFGATPLLCAAINGHAAVTEQLIEARCNIDFQNKDGATALYFAAQNGHPSVTKQLIEARSNINHQEHGGYTPQRSRYEDIRHLLQSIILSLSFLQ